MACDKKELGHGGPFEPLDWLKIRPHEVAASSDRLGRTDLQAARCRAPARQLDVPALTHHRLFLFIRPPDELDIRYEWVRRHLTALAATLSLLLQGSPTS